MNCRRVVSLLSAYVDGELTGVEMLGIRRHLAECSECEEEHQAVLFTKQALSRLRSVAPREDFAAMLMSNLCVVQVSPYQKAANSLWRFAHTRIAPVAAAAAAAGVVLVVLSSGTFNNDDQMMASVPFASQSVGVSFMPEVYSSNSAVAASRPLRVTNDSTSLTSSKYRFASFSGLK
ncbi:MAG: anti-sigma factor [Armatimonadetes bacterium]|nr:anti-sigma factor [Armatimonadota bacterium]